MRDYFTNKNCYVGRNQIIRPKLVARLVSARKFWFDHNHWNNKKEREIIVKIIAWECQRSPEY
jgi:hypothetical protein